MIIQIKSSANTGNAPLSLANGELALNYADQLLYYKHANGSIVVLANGQSLGTTTDEFARLVANGAFATANAAYAEANLAYSVANTAQTISLAAFADANAAFVEANAAFAEAQSAFAKANTAAQNAFSTIATIGQNNVVALSNSSTLTLVAGESIDITTDPANDAITLAVTTINGGTF